MNAIFAKPYSIMGIVNVTPDSFSDGGKFHTTDAAVDHALSLVHDGADLLDIGGESTRPGAKAVSVKEECARVVPVIKRIVKKCPVPISVDTTKALVAQAALDAGATWVNDVSAGRFDPKMASLVSRRKCMVILMHSRGTPKTMQQDPYYADVVAEVKGELLAAASNFENAGVLREKIVLDPGIGFAKRVEDNCMLIARLNSFSDLGYPMCLGASRKSFIGALTGKATSDRLAGSLAAVAAAYTGGGCTLFRVHDVAATRDLLCVLSSCNSRTIK